MSNERECHVKFMKSNLVAAAVLVTLSALPSVAQTSDADTATSSPLKRGSTVNNAANANQKAPGTAQELAPDTKQSATGGPSGGTGRGGASGGN